MIRKLAALAALLSLAACASATKRMEQGQELQRAGRPAEAAERYIQALKKDRTLDSARAGLRSAGGEAIAGYLRVAADPITPADRAADQYVAVDDLAKRALEVGIYLVVPSDYETKKRATFDKAIDAAVLNARSLSASGQYADAVARIQRAVNNYHPSQNQDASLGRAAAEATIAWAKSDTASGQYRAAVARLDQVPNLPGVTQTQTSEASVIQQAAMARATRKVIIVPVSATATARLNLPEEVLPAMADAMRDDPWATPPRFVSLVQRDLVEQSVRFGRLNQRTMTNTDASRLAQILNADWVVVSEIDSVRHDGAATRVTRRPIRTRSGVDTAYYLDEGQARLYGRSSFVIYDRNGARVSDFLYMDASATASFARVRYNGDYRTLDLSQAERDLFERHAGDQALVRAFVDQLSPRLGNALYAEVVRRIP